MKPLFDIKNNNEKTAQLETIIALEALSFGDLGFNPCIKMKKDDNNHYQIFLREEETNDD